MGTKNTQSRRKESDPIWRRMYLLGKMQKAQADLIKQVSALPPEQGAKEIDALIAATFAVPAKKTDKKV